MDIEVLRAEAVAAAHPAANVFPIMGDDELRLLADDIRANGLREPIFRDGNGQIIDGRNRWIACRLAEAHCGEIEFGQQHGEPVTFIISHNLRRRHLDESQRAIVAAKIANLSHGGDRKSEEIKGPAGTLIGGTSAKAAAEMLNVGERSVKRARAVLRNAKPEVVEKVERGAMTVREAERTYPKQPERQVQPAPKPRESKPAPVVVPESITRLVMWLRTGSRLFEELDGGANATEAAERCGIALNQTDLSHVESFVAGMMSATKAERAA